MKKLMFLTVLTAVLLTLAGTAFGAAVNVDDTVQYQQMDGFGASYTDSSAYLVYESGLLNSTEIQTLVNDLFNPVSGIGLNVLRQPMGASDFRVINDYTYNDMPAGETDYNLDNFSISHDLAYIIPAILDAQAANSNLKVKGVPWSAPAWMKTNESLRNGGSLIDSDAIYETYSDYFVKYIDAYAARGINIWAVSLQNEPEYGPISYPGLLMSEADQIRLAKVLGPKLGTTKIMAYDHNWDNPGYPITVLDDADARVHFSGSAFHCYGGDVAAQTTVHNAHPDKDIYFTECTGALEGKFENDLLWMMQNLLIGATRNWASTVIEWNLVLDETGGPKIAGGCEDCKGIVEINSVTGEVTKMPEYYAFGHLSKFVKPGAYRIASDNTETVAFRNPDTSLVLLIFNGSRNKTVTYDVNWNGQSFSYSIPSRSAATFTWPDVSGALVSVWQTNSDKSKLLEQQGNVQFDGAGSFCGDGTCDPGEDQCNCSADCGTPPSTETSCSDGIDNDCDLNTDCDDGDCTDDPACIASFCGDETCDPDEDQCNCSADCGTPPSTETSCSDGIDNDCDLNTDCDDGDCDGDPACEIACDGDGICEPGEDCVDCPSDCEGKDTGGPYWRFCCGNGIVEIGEGDGTICDGNF